MTDLYTEMPEVQEYIEEEYSDIGSDVIRFAFSRVESILERSSEVGEDRIDELISTGRSAIGAAETIDGSLKQYKSR